MKKINNFFDTASLWKVYVVMCIVFTFISYSIMYILLGTFLKLDFFNFDILRGSFILSLFGSLLITLSIMVIRESDKFYKELQNIEKEIDENNTKDELQKLYKERLLPLYKKSYSTGQMSEIVRLKSVMEMKYKLLKD